MRANWENKAFLTALLLLAAVMAGAADREKMSEWKVEAVDSSGAGKFASLKVDANGDVHVAYVPETDGHPLKYAFWDHHLDKWFTMTVTNIASFSTLVLDSKQHPHISFADHGTGNGAKLRYAHWDGTKWQIEAVSPRTQAVVGYYTSIALDASDKPVFSFYDYASPGGDFILRLRSVFRQDNYWQVLTVDPQGGSGKFNSIAVDSKGLPHIAYANVKAETSGLRYASWNGTSWVTERLEGINGPVPIFSVSMILDKNDTPHITYSEVVTGLVKYATKVGGRWVIQAVDRIRVAYPDRNGIALDKDGNVYLSYYDAGEGCLKIAYSNAGKWYAESLDKDGSGFTSSLAIQNDTLWVAYSDEGNAGLRVARKSLAGFTTAQVSASQPPTASNGK